MHFTLHQLQIFLKITELKSITKASEALNLTQPAVSIQLKNFQEQFPYALTEVIGRKLYVTDFGLEIASAADKILNEANGINYKTLDYAGKLAGKLKISVVSTGKYVMPYFLSDFMKQNDGIDLIMDVTNKSKVVDSLELNEVDFALVSVVPEKLNIEKIELMENKLFLVANSKLNLEKKVNIFDKFPLIYREEGSATREVMENYILKRKFAIRKKMVLTSNEAIKQAIVSDLGISIMPLIGIRYELQNNDVQIIPTKGLPINTSWNLIWLKSKKMTPAAKAFIEHINSNKEQIIQENFEWINKFNV